MEICIGVLFYLSLQPMIAVVQHQGFSLIDQQLSNKQPSGRSEKVCFSWPYVRCFTDISSPSMEVPREVFFHLANKKGLQMCKGKVSVSSAKNYPSYLQLS